jgi:hypothetical protein
MHPPFCKSVQLIEEELRITNILYFLLATSKHDQNDDKFAHFDTIWFLFGVPLGLAVGCAAAMSCAAPFGMGCSTGVILHSITAGIEEEGQIRAHGGRGGEGAHNGERMAATGETCAGGSAAAHLFGGRSSRACSQVGCDSAALCEGH